MVLLIFLYFLHIMSEVYINDQPMFFGQQNLQYLLSLYLYKINSFLNCIYQFLSLRPNKIIIKHQKA